MDVLETMQHAAFIIKLKSQVLPVEVQIYACMYMYNMYMYLHGRLTCKIILHK